MNDAETEVYEDSGIGDVNSPAAEESSKHRKTIRRFYVVENNFVSREKGVDTILIGLDDERLPAKELMVEGLVSLLVRGVELSTILEGLDDRSPPTKRVAVKKPRVERKPSIFTRAIALVISDELTAIARRNGGKPDKFVIADEALKRAREFTVNQRKKANKLASVQVALAKLRGSSGSLHDVMEEPSSLSGE